MVVLAVPAQLREALKVAVEAFMMPFSRRLRALNSWIACFAILLSAMRPTLSHAFRSDLTSGVPAGWIEICSVVGAEP